MRGFRLLCLLRAVGAFTPLVHMERARKVARMAAAADSEWALPALAKLPRASLALRRVEPGSAALTAAAALETASYPADEAASPARLAERATVAGEFFLGLFDISGGAAPAADPPLVGFVCATAAPLAGGLTEAAMGTHDAAGELLCIHSVVVEPRWRRKGVASAMLRAYFKRPVGALSLLKISFGAARSVVIYALWYSSPLERRKSSASPWGHHRPSRGLCPTSSPLFAVRSWSEAE